MKTFKHAFTLAEVLVTLMIIGVIAAMTIPGLRKNTEMRELAVGCKKAYTSLSQAMLLTEQENGSTNRWPNAATDATTVWQMIKPHLNVSKDCTQAGSTKCWTEGTILPLSGTGKPETFKKGSVDFKLADGANGTFDITVPGKKKNEKGEATEEPDGVLNSFIFYIDVNGDKKPNTLGVDIFGFADYADGNGLVPLGSGLADIVVEGEPSKANYGDCTSAGEGTQCAIRVIKEGAINY